MSAAQLIFNGGTILTMNDNMPQAEALAVTDGRISAVGNWEQVRSQSGTDTKIVDLQGKTLMPGLIEPHSHPIVSALLYDWIDVSGFQNISGDEIMNKLRRAATKAEPGKWIAAFGYDPILTRDLKALNADILDQISTTNPVLVMVQTMHTIYVNHAALKRAGITDDTPQPELGTYVKNASGRLTGMIIEQGAALPLLGALLADNAYDGPQLMHNQINLYANAGYTTVGVMGDFPVFDQAITTFKSIVESDDCPIRAGYMDKATDLEIGFVENLGADSDRFRYLGVKFWYDGSPYTGNMLLSEPFLNSPLMQGGLSIPKDTCGYSMMPKEQMAALVQKYHDQGHQIAIHGQGDKAISDILDMYQQALEATPRDDHRHRIEHGALYPLEELERSSRLGVAPSWHINHIHYYGEALRDEILGPQRTNNMMPFGNAIQAGLTCSLHNDTPMYPPEPFKLLRTATTRMTRQNAVIGGNQAVDMNQALRAMTIDAAWQLFMEKSIGSLEEGKLADLVVFSENPLEVPPEEITRVDALATYREGVEYKVS